MNGQGLVACGDQNDNYKISAEFKNDANGNSMHDLMEVDSNGTSRIYLGDPPVIDQRSHPIIHSAADPPLCSTCEQLDIDFFNTQCPGCCEKLSNLSTSVAQIFSIIRQWVPHTQRNIELFAGEILKRGAHVDDRDGLTDMTLLHYACKAGSSGVGDAQAALKTVQMLVELFDADVSLRCRWTDMNAIHYAVYFDVGPVLEFLLEATKNVYIDDICRDFDGGTPLHIAASNLCLQSTKILLKQGANVLLKDDLSRTPLDCVPESVIQPNVLETEAGEITNEMKKLLEDATLACIPGEGLDIQGPVTGKVVLQALGLNLGDRVVISNTKVGTLRYCGATQFATSIWAGVELDQPEGKNDGTVNGVTYFRCAPNCGIFAPINKITKFDEISTRYIKGTNTLTFKNVNYPKVNVAHITPKVETGLSNLKSKTINSIEISVGNRVIMVDKRVGVVRFVGETQFAPGFWYGIELEKPNGKNDGSVNGIRYFDCKQKHGIFANSTRIQRILTEARRLEFDSDTSSEISLSLSRSSMENSLRPSFTPNVLKARSRSSQIKEKLIQNQSPQSKDTWLTVGVNVFINNTIGVVRYIGPVDFADGTWLGVELRTPTGKNDGSVNNRRYFNCKPKHGLLVRPKKVSVRGINGAKLLPDQPKK